MSQSTAPGAMKYPESPATMAVTALPAWLKASLRPTRRVNRPRPTIPKLIAATANGKMASAIPLTACATAMDQNCGARAITVAAMATARALTAINVRFQ